METSDVRVGLLRLARAREEVTRLEDELRCARKELEEAQNGARCWAVVGDFGLAGPPRLLGHGACLRPQVARRADPRVLQAGSGASATRALRLDAVRIPLPDHLRHGGSDGGRETDQSLRQNSP